MPGQARNLEVKKSCKYCGETDPENLVNLNSYTGRIYKRNLCNSCRSLEDDLNKLEFPEKHQAKLQHKKDRRAKRIGIEKDILRDSRKFDRRKGFENDLTHEFILEQIGKGCRYCSGNELRMTLDRIENSKGHTQDNVVPACVRCNYVRRDMPYKAWLNIAPYIKSAYDRGLFGDWTGQARKCK